MRSLAAALLICLGSLGSDPVAPVPPASSALKLWEQGQRAMLEGKDPSESLFPSSQAILDYATHRLLWSWYRRDRDANVRLPAPLSCE